MVHDWECGGVYRQYDMTGEIELPNNSRVVVGDWTEILPQFMLQADTLFIDPPWNQKVAVCFYTKSGLQPPVTMNYLTISEILIERIEQIDPKHLFVEIGKEWLGWYLQRIKDVFRYVTFYNSTYYHRQSSKCYVIHATNEYKHRRYKALEDLDEEDIVRWLCENHSYECIGDLCMGRGMVGRGAYLAGKRFVGMELNKKRLALLLKFVHDNEEN